jgi:hypothetical protein
MLQEQINVPEIATINESSAPDMPLQNAEWEQRHFIGMIQIERAREIAGYKSPHGRHHHADIDGVRASAIVPKKFQIV